MSELDKLRQVGARLPDPSLVLQLFESATDGIIVINRHSLICLVNKQAELIFGYHRTELYDKPIHMLLPLSLREAHTKHIEGYMRDPRARAMGEGRVLLGLCRDGKEVNVSISLIPLMTSDGMLVAANIRVHNE